MSPTKEEERGKKKKREDEVPLHREPRDEEPFWDRRGDEVPEQDHVITHPTRARRPVDRSQRGEEEDED